MDAPQLAVDLVGLVWRSCDGGGEPDELDRLSVWRVVAHEAEVAISAGVVRARAAGATWAEVGDALGMTRQGAHQRFGMLDGSPA